METTMDVCIRSACAPSAVGNSQADKSSLDLSRTRHAQPQLGSISVYETCAGGPPYDRHRCRSLHFPTAGAHGRIRKNDRAKATNDLRVELSNGSRDAK